MKNCDFCKCEHTAERPVRTIKATINLLRNLGDPDSVREPYKIQYKDACESCYTNLVLPNFQQNLLTIRKA